VLLSYELFAIFLKPKSSKSFFRAKRELKAWPSETAFGRFA
jgi:hypothetical protein